MFMSDIYLINISAFAETIYAYGVNDLLKTEINISIKK